MHSRATQLVKPNRVVIVVTDYTWAAIMKTQKNSLQILLKKQKQKQKKHDTHELCDFTVE